MTTLLTTHDIARIVSAHGLPHVLLRLEAAITADFRRWGDFDKVARVASHSKTGVIELMPVADAARYSFKYVNGHPNNGLVGLPTVMAFGVLADVATGAPTLLSELTITTAMRTAATSVMAARALARPGSRSMAIIGNGAQSEFQALAFHHLLGIDELRLFDIDPQASEKLVRNLRPIAGLTVKVCANTAQAVQGADIITTITADKRNRVIIDAGLLERGMHLNAVGGDCPGKTELSADVLKAAAVFVEYEPQTRLEGELQQMPPEFGVTEIWRVLQGQVAGRRSAEEVTLFDSVGFALEDFSALVLMSELARQLGLGQRVALIPALADPKDLFSQLAKPGLQLRAA
jgi:ornithine cyclodeaminase